QLQVRQQVYALEKQLAVEARSVDMAGVQIQIKKDQDFYDQKSAHIKALFDLGQISARAEIAQLKAVEAERFAQMQADLKEKLQFANQDVATQQRVYAELE